MTLRKEIEDQETEQNFFVDIVDAVVALYFQRRNKWPPVSYLGAELERWEAKLSVGFVELYDTGMFCNMRDVGSFMRYYEKYDFLVPKTINKFGISPCFQVRWTREIGATAGDRLGLQIVRLGSALQEMLTKKDGTGKKLRTLREQVEDAGNIVDQRRARRAAQRSREPGDAKIFAGAHSSTANGTAGGIAGKAANGGMLSNNGGVAHKILNCDYHVVANSDATCFVEDMQSTEALHGHIEDAMSYHDQALNSNLDTLHEAINALLGEIKKTGERQRRHLDKQEVGCCRHISLPCGCFQLFTQSAMLSFNLCPDLQNRYMSSTSQCPM